MERPDTVFPAKQFARDWAYQYKKLLKSHLNAHNNNVTFSCIQSSRVKYFSAVQVHFQWFTKSTLKQRLRNIQLGQPNKLALEDRLKHNHHIRHQETKINQTLLHEPVQEACNRVGAPSHKHKRGG